MARIARIVAPGLPHHLIQRGNRRQETFFNDSDYDDYLKLLHAHSNKFNTEILAYCLMPNHVHIIAVPAREDSLAKAIGQTHLKYTRMINFRENWRGYLWQGRFSSYVLDERYLLAAVRYILLNPVKAKLVEYPWDYKWSSARHHLGIEKGKLVTNGLINTLIGDWKEFLRADTGKSETDLFELHERTGKPLGDIDFTEKLEKILSRSLKRKKPGPKVEKH
jgi:putative transposase